MYKRFYLTVLTLCLAAGVAFAEEGSENQAAPSADAVKPLSIGDTIPAVTLKDSSGEAFDLNAAIAGQKTALVYYRGGWCPFCNMHWKALAEIEGDIADAGYQMIGISADRPDDVKKAESRRTDSHFKLLSDDTMEVARAFGLAFGLDEPTVEKYKGYGIDLHDEHGQVHNSLPVPAFYLIGADGKVTYEFHDPDYKVRISNEEVLEAIGK